MKTILTIQGTHCASCKALIEDVARDIPGIHSCTVNFKTGETIVEHEENFDWGLLKKDVEALGNYKIKMEQ